MLKSFAKLYESQVLNNVSICISTTKLSYRYLTVSVDFCINIVPIVTVLFQP